MHASILALLLLLLLRCCAALLNHAAARRWLRPAQRLMRLHGTQGRGGAPGRYQIRSAVPPCRSGIKHGAAGMPSFFEPES
jgi:hypothetical protein